MGYGIQDQNEDATVKVNAGINRKTGEPQTDVIISEAGHADDHRHIVFDANGNKVYDEYNKNH